MVVLILWQEYIHLDLMLNFKLYRDENNYKEFDFICCLGSGRCSCVDLDTAPYDRETDLTYWEEDPEAAVKR